MAEVRSLEQCGVALLLTERRRYDGGMPRTLLWLEGHMLNQFGLMFALALTLWALGEAIFLALS